MFPLGESPRGMAGASFRHALIAGNLHAEIHAQLKGGPCRVVMNDLRVALGSDSFAYPDLVVFGGKPQFLGGEFDTLTNPLAILEVLSPSTEYRDRGSKFAHYRRLPSLLHYVLVGQETPTIERCDRQPDDSWLLTDLTWPEGILNLANPPLAVSLRDIYANSFDPDPTI